MTIKYVEPADYFPKSVRKKYGLGEYNKDVENAEKSKKKPKAKKKK